MIAAWLSLAAALANPLGYGTPHCVGNPPARFQGDATVIVHFTNRAGIKENCGERVLACQLDHEIWARNPCTTKEAADLASLDSDLCHELGHVNGWPDNHPR